MLVDFLSFFNLMVIIMGFVAYIVYYFWQVIYFLEHVKGFREANCQIKHEELTFQRYQNFPSQFTKNFRKSAHDYSEYVDQQHRRFAHGVQAIFGLFLVIVCLFPIWYVSNQYNHAFFSGDFVLFPEYIAYQFLRKVCKFLVLYHAVYCIHAIYRLTMNLKQNESYFFSTKKEKSVNMNEIQESILTDKFDRTNDIVYLGLSLFVYYLLWI